MNWTRAFPGRDPEAVLFDLDGLLIDTERMVMAAFREVLGEMALPFEEALFARLMGLTSQDSTRILESVFGTDFPLEAFRARTSRCYEAAVREQGIPLRPGATEVLDAVAEHGTPYACATSSAAERARWKLERAGIGGRFDTLVGGDDVARGKPAPDIFLEASRRLGIAPRSCLVLEDSPAGVRAAAAAGMRVILVPDVIDPDPETRTLADALAPDLHAVADRFRGVTVRTGH